MSRTPRNNPVKGNVIIALGVRLYRSPLTALLAALELSIALFGLSNHRSLWAGGGRLGPRTAQLGSIFFWDKVKNANPPGVRAAGGVGRRS